METSKAFTLLDVGAPRTGTQSMYDAMKILGLNPLHSGYLPEARDPLCHYLFGNSSLDEALGVLEGFDGGMDEPFMLMYEEIMSAFPESKFLLTISDGESWFNNYAKLRSLQMPLNESSVQDLPFYLDLCAAMKSWGCDFLNAESKDRLDCPCLVEDLCLKNYYRHIERVQQVIPAQRLLVYNWSDGWAPLCHFLGKPIPDVPFPHEDAVMTHAIKVAMDTIRQASG
eukprot:Skav212307  [mRNA]  locus=scaffold732:746196:748048:- [translate_table: standard]